MEIIERTDACLVIEDSSWRTAVALVGAAVAAGFVVSRQANHFWQAGIGPAFLLLMAWIAKFRTVTSFHRERNVVRHERRRIGRRKEEYSLQDVIEIGLRLPPLSRHYGGWPSRDTALETPSGSHPAPVANVKRSRR